MTAHEIENVLFVVVGPCDGGRAYTVAYAVGLSEVVADAAPSFKLPIAGADVVVYDYESTVAVLGQACLDGRRSIFDVAGYLRYLGVSDGLGGLFSVAEVEQGNARLPSRTLEAVRLVYGFACADPHFPGIEFRVCDHTACINDRGVLVDHDAATAFAVAVGRARQRELSHLAASHPRFDTRLVRNETVVKEYASWLGTDDGAAFIRSVRQVQQLDQAARRAEKYRGIGQRARPLLRWNGAHTGRFSARSTPSGINVHGLPKGGNESPELALERGVIVPPPGRLFCAADLSGIEARIVAWLTDPEALQRFRDEPDVYAWFARQVFPGKPVTAVLRKLAKASVLGLCFGMGLDTFITRASEDVPESSRTDIERAFEVYHQTFKEVRSTIEWCARGVAMAHAGHPQQVGRLRFRPDHYTVRSTLPSIALELPTGRTLYYRGVVASDSAVAPPHVTGLWYAPSYTPSGPQRNPRRDGLVRFHDGIWRARLSGNVVLENAAQGIARDVMVHQALELDARGLPVQFHVHDEIVVACADCGCDRHVPGCAWSRAVELLVAVMSTVPPSLPELAELPLAASPNPAVSRRYG